MNPLINDNMKNDAITIDEPAIMDMLKDIFEHEENMQKYMETQAAESKEKDALIERLLTESKQQREDFATKMANIKVTVPAPDLSIVQNAITTGLAGIGKGLAIEFTAIRETINKGPAPVTRKLQLFTDAKTPEQYKAVLSWIVYGVLGLVALIGTFMLLWHLSNLNHAG